MRHMLEKNIGIVTSRQAQSGFKHVFISDKMIEFNLTGTAGRYGSGYLFPLYLYREKNKKTSSSSIKLKKSRIFRRLFLKNYNQFMEKSLRRKKFFTIFTACFTVTFTERLTPNF